MQLAKVTAIILITAIFNPLCCCLNLLTASEAQTAPSPSELHACCVDSESASDTLEHDSYADCPHSIAKDSQISESSDTHNTLSKQFAPVLYELCWIDSPSFAFQTESVACFERSSDLRPHSPPIAQTYCVYLI